MATHDYVIANQSGAAFRTDLNNALAAIVSNNSNSSEPATMYAYQWWADTNTGTLKIRNSTNNGWVELLQLDGTLTLEDGSASTPGLAFRDDLNTGIFSSAADTFNVATAGVERMRINSSGNLLVGTTSPVINDSGVNEIVLAGKSEGAGIHLADDNNNVQAGMFTSDGGGGTFFIRTITNNPMAFRTNNTERLRIDTSGNLNFSMEAASGYPTQQIKWSNDSTTTNGFYIAQHSDRNGRMWHEQGLGLVFGTSNTERMRIDSSGNVSIGSTSNVAPLNVRGMTDGNLHVRPITSIHSGTGVGLDVLNDANSAVKDLAIRAATTVFRNASAESMRIDSAGQVLVGTTSSNSVSAALVSAVGSVPGYYANPAGLSVTTGNNANAHCVEFFQGRFDKRVLTLSSNYDQSVTFQVFEQADVNVGIITGNGSTTNFNTNPSDRSLKKNFESWDENVLSLFKNINPQKFNYLQENDGDKKSKGFIAQEMLDSFPEAYPLVEHENDKYYFNPSGMVVYLMKAIQELEAKVAALEAA